MRTPLPRSSQELLNNKELVLNKLALTHPEHVDMVNEMLTHQPEALDDSGKLLVNMVPELFQHDAYNRFNGKISDPMMKAKANADLIKDDNLSNTEKALRSNRLNKTGEF
jgi:hypothetical protein